MPGLSLGLGLGLSPATGVPYEPEASALFARATTAVSDAEKVRANKRIVRLKAAGLWPLLDALYGYKTAGLSTLNWKGLAFTLTPTGSITHTENRGWQAAGGRLGTAFVPSAEALAGAQFQRDNSLIGVRPRQPATGVSRTQMGAQSGGAYYTHLEASSGNAIIGRMNQPAGGGGAVVNFSAGVTDLWAVKRTGATALSAWLGARKAATISTASTGLPNVEIYIAATNSGGSPVGASTDMIQSAMIGSAPTDEQSALLALIEMEYVTDIVAWGDSLTGADYPALAAEIFSPGRDVSNRGIGGQTSTQIAARLGAQPITVTVSGGQIPTSGGVSVTAKNINILTNSGSFLGTATGHLAGVRGEMSTDASGNWTFTPFVSPASNVAVPPGSVFTPDLGDFLRNQISWLWLGANGAQGGYTVEGDIAACVSHLGHGRYLVGSILPSAADNAAAIAAKAAQSSALASTYGSRFVDLLGPLQAANDGSANDLADVAAGLVPRSLRIDNIHLNITGYAVVAARWAAVTTAFGW